MLHIPYSITGDIPTNEAKYFNFDTYCASIISVIQESHVETPFSIAINGCWGSGKTSLMKTIKDELDSSSNHQERKIKTVWFDAWKYPDNNSLFAELAFEIYQQIVLDKEIKKFDYLQYVKRKIKFFRNTKRINSLKIISDFSNLLINSTIVTQGILPIKQSKIDINSWVNKPFYENNLTFYRRFQQYLLAVFEVYISERDGSPTDSSDGLLVVFIDDLDRCAPKTVANILEAINLFFDQKGCLFIMGMDLNVISKAIESQYNEYLGEDHSFSGRNYLKKMIQLEFTLPKIRQEDMTGFVNELIGTNETLNILKQNSMLIIDTLDENPREIKRFINLFKFVKILQSYRGCLVIDDELLIKWFLLDFASGEFVSSVKNDPALLISMQNYIQEQGL